MSHHSAYYRLRRRLRQADRHTKMSTDYVAALATRIQAMTFYDLDDLDDHYFETMSINPGLETREKVLDSLSGSLSRLEQIQLYREVTGRKVPDGFADWRKEYIDHGLPFAYEQMLHLTTVHTPSSILNKPVDPPPTPQKRHIIRRDQLALRITIGITATGLVSALILFGHSPAMRTYFMLLTVFLTTLVTRLIDKRNRP